MTVTGGGGFSSLPSGFPHPVPEGTVLSGMQDGITVQSGAAIASWGWDRVVYVRASKVGALTYVVGTLWDASTFNVAVRRGGERFAEAANLWLRDWESQLTTEQAAQRRLMKERLAARTEAKRDRSERARKLPILGQSRATGYVIQPSTGVHVGGGPVHMDEKGITIHDPSGNRRLAFVPYEVIGAFEGQSVDAPADLVAPIYGSNDMDRMVVRPGEPEKWLEQLRVFVDFAAELLEVEPAAPCDPAATSRSIEDFAKRGLNRMHAGECEGPDGAVHWFRQAADGGHPGAMCNLGVIRHEQGIDEGGDGSLHWYRLAADAGHPLAEFNIGNARLSSGDINGTDGAIYWYSRSAASGHGPAMFNLGTIYQHSSDEQSAIAWYRKAARKGLSDAMFNLGSMQGQLGNVDGAGGAVYWYERAAVLGHEQAAVGLQRIRS